MDTLNGYIIWIHYMDTLKKYLLKNTLGEYIRWIILKKYF